MKAMCYNVVLLALLVSCATPTHNAIASSDVDYDVANKYYDVMSGVVEAAGLKITPDGEEALRRVSRDVAEKTRGMSEEEEKSARAFAGEVAENARFSEKYARKVVDSDVVDTTLRLLCPPPFYPFC